MYIINSVTEHGQGVEPAALRIYPISTQGATIMLQYQLPIGKKVKQANGENKTEEVGKVAITVPLLEDTGLSGWEVALDPKTGKPAEDDEGFPLYVKDEHNWILDAMIQAVKAKARNKLMPGTVQLKPGLAIAADWAMLCAEGDRTQGVEVLAAIREVKSKFATWIASLGKSAAAQKNLNVCFSNKDALTVQTKENKAKMLNYITEFVEKGGADSGTLEKATRYIQNLIDSCETVVNVEDF